MSKIKTALIVMPYFPPAGGGLERYGLEIAARLNSDHEWRIVFVTAGEQEVPDEKYFMQGMLIYRLGYRYRFSNTPFDLGWFKKVKRILQEENPDIINVHTPVPGLGNIVALLSSETPLVVTYHSGSMRKGRFWTDILIWLYENGPLKLMLRQAYSIICSSDFVRYGFLRPYLYKSTTITPAADEIFKPAEKKVKNKNVLFVAGLGSAEQHKGLKLLIDAIKKLKYLIPDIHLTVVGDGDMKNEYENYVSAHGLQDQIIFRGKLAGDKLALAYQEASLFVLPTINDSMPTVIIEAMMSGLPVISTPVGSISSLVEDGRTGYLVAPNNLGELAGKMADILLNPSLASVMGEAGRVKVASGFGWQERVEEYDRLFNSALAASPLIVHVAAYYPPHMGGLENVAKTAAEFTAQAGYRTLVITSDQGIDKNALKPPAGLVISALRSFEFAHTPFAPALFWHLLFLPHNSIIHLHLAQAYFPELVLLAAKLRGVRYIAHFHLDVEPSGPLGHLFVLYKKIVWGPVLRSAHRVITCSSDQRSVVRLRFGVRPDNIIIIPNGVSADFFSDRAYLLPEKELRLLYVGRLTVQKRVDRLIEAMTLLSIPVYLTIVGDGEDRLQLETLVRRLKLKNVSFVGAKNAKEMQNYHQENDIFLISSDKEGGTPLVALEAMAGGLPVIGSNVSGVSGLLRGVGILVDGPYPAEFAKAIMKLWRSPEKLLELSRLSAAKAREYDWSSFGRQLLQVYQNLSLVPVKIKRPGSLSLERNALLLIFGLCWLGFVILTTTGFNFLQIGNITAFLFLLFIPGSLTMFALRLKGLETWAYVCLAMAFSLLELMIMGLAGNTILPFFGITRPLTLPYLFPEISFLFIGLACAAWARMAKINIRLYRYLFFNTAHDLFFAFLPLTFTLLAVLGAIRLNNGGSNILTLAMLAGMAVYAVALFKNNNKLHENVAPAALFLMAVPLLLMTSLRGWYITGHDIQFEYKVFELAKNAGIWSMASYRDAYNACLSITILPAIFANFLKIADPYIYKFFFQIIFAFSSVIAYLVSRNWLNRNMSLLAGLFFISFPTFFEDMPFLVRQEIAFLFYGLMIYIIFKKIIDLNTRRVLFLLLGIGVIFSHYSTIYTVLLIFGLAVLNNKVLGIFSRQQVKITLSMVMVLFSLSLTWTMVITNTGGNVTKVINETIAAVKNGFSENSRSIDAISLLSFSKPDQAQEVSDYMKNEVTALRASAPAGEYYPDNIFANYSFAPLGEERLPLTALGRFLARLHINTNLVIPWLGQMLAKLMEILAPLGLMYVVYRKLIMKYMDREYCLLALYSLSFILLNILLPVLSTEYGVFRAMQQSMFVLAPFIIIGVTVLGTMLINSVNFLHRLIAPDLTMTLKPVSRNNPLMLFLTVSFFLFSTSLLPQMFGGNVPQLHLNNAGRYYDNFLMHRPELQSINWLDASFKDLYHAPDVSQPEVQADKFAKFKIKSVTDLALSGDIFPLLIKQRSFVILDEANVTKQRSNIIYQNDAILYEYAFPLQFLDANKNLVYNNGGARIYK